MNSPTLQFRVNRVAIKDLETGEVVVHVCRRSEDTSWNDAQAIFKEFVESSYAETKWTAPKNFLVFFRTDYAPVGLEVLAPSKMIAQFIPEENVTQRSIIGAPEWDYDEEIFPYKLDFLDRSVLADGEFPSHAETVRKPKSARSLERVKSSFLNLTATFATGSEEPRLGWILHSKDNLIFGALNDGVRASAWISDKSSNIGNEGIEPRTCSLALLASKWISLEIRGTHNLIWEKDLMIGYFNTVAPGFIESNFDLDHFQKLPGSSIQAGADWFRKVMAEDNWSLLLLNLVFDEFRLLSRLLRFEAPVDLFCACAIFHEIAAEDFAQVANSIDNSLGQFREYTSLDNPSLDHSGCESARLELEKLYREMEFNHGLEFGFLRRIGAL